MIISPCLPMKAFHYLKNKKKGKHGEMIMKIDMNKTYDMVGWDFLAQVLLKMGFYSDCVEKVMLCIDSVNFSLLFFGKKVVNFRPKRGLRQGDPLSPISLLLLLMSFLRWLSWLFLMEVWLVLSWLGVVPLFLTIFSLFHPFPSAERDNCAKLV